MSELPTPTVGVFNWGRKGWRVSAYQPAPHRDWNAMGHPLAEQFCRTEASAKRLAAKWAKDYGADLAMPQRHITPG